MLIFGGVFGRSRLDALLEKWNKIADNDTD
jgi:hypothetical protein